MGPVCPSCDAPLSERDPRCPACGFAVIDERAPRRIAVGLALAVPVAMAAALAGPPLWRAADTALTPASEPLSAEAAEREIAARYPRVRDLRHSLIACPSRSIEPGGEARCWVQLAVGLQRSLVVRLSARGNAIEIDD